MITNGFFNANLVDGDYDRKYTAEQLAEFFATLVGNGVFSRDPDSFRVLPGSGLSLNVSPGYAWINGYWVKNDDDENIQEVSLTSTGYRTDIVILRLNQVDRVVELKLLQGSVSSSYPAPMPEYQRTDAMYDLVLASISMSSDTYAISSDSITDLRSNTQYCGVLDTFANRLIPAHSIQAEQINLEDLFTRDIHILGDTTLEGSVEEGSGTSAAGQNSHAGGLQTIAAGDNQTVLGKYNLEDTDNRYALIIGNGISGQRSNALELTWTGQLNIISLIASSVNGLQGLFTRGLKANGLDMVLSNIGGTSTVSYNSIVPAMLGNSSKTLIFSVPLSRPLYSGINTISCSDLSVTMRHPDGLYPYARSGSNGNTYTQLGSGFTSVWSNRRAVRTGEITTITCSNRTDSIRVQIEFTYALTKTSGNTAAVTNQVPIGLDINATFTLS